MVKQIFAFAQRGTNICLPTEKESFTRQDQKQYQYKKHFHGGDNYDNQYYDSDVYFNRRGNNFGRFNHKRQNFYSHKGRGRGGGGEEEEEDLTTIIISTLLNNRLNRRKDHITIRIILIGTTRITQHRIRQVENMINHLHHINRGITRLISNLKNKLVITVTGHIKPPGNCVRLCVHDNHPSCYL